jgi:hypothetical protein
MRTIVDPISNHPSSSPLRMLIPDYFIMNGSLACLALTYSSLAKIS